MHATFWALGGKAFLVRPSWCCPDAAAAAAAAYQLTGGQDARGPQAVQLFTLAQASHDVVHSGLSQAPGERSLWLLALPSLQTYHSSIFSVIRRGVTSSQARSTRQLIMPPSVCRETNTIRVRGTFSSLPSSRLATQRQVRRCSLECQEWVSSVLPLMLSPPRSLGCNPPDVRVRGVAE
jgi:hypothetical protein